MTNVDHLAALELLREEGAISDQEFEDLRGEILSPDDAHPDDAHPDESSLTTPDNRARDRAVFLQWRPTVRTDLPPKYPLALLAIAALLVVASLAGIVSWVVSFLAVLALTATLVKGGIRVTIAAGLGILAIVVVGVIGNSSNSPTVPANNDAAAVPAAEPIVAGALGVGLDELVDRWNALDQPPAITRGLTLGTEPGQYDSFIYRFGDWGRLAGAYDPSTDALHGLLAAGQLSNGATDQLYLHLCFVLHPYSQECIDSYFEQGLDYRPLAEFGDTSHQAQWEMGDQTWLLEIEGNVLTIRARAPDVG